MAFRYSPNIVTDGLVLYVDVANNKTYSGSGSDLNDLTRNEISGTLVNSPSFGNDFLGGMTFNGSTQGANFGNDSKLGLTEMTLIVVSSQVSDPSVLGTLIGRYGNGANGFSHNYYFFIETSGRMRFAFKDTGGSYNTTITNYIPDIGEVSHMCVSYSPSESKKFYVNGEVYSSYFSDGITNQIPEVSSSSNLSLSYSASENAFYNNNQLHIAKIYNRVLSEDEVKRNYNALKGRFGL